jgi:hypothetical protein
VRGAGGAEVEARIVDREHQVDLAGVEQPGDPGEEAAEEAQVADHLDEAHHGELIQAGEQLDALGLHVRPAEPDQPCARQALA